MGCGRQRHIDAFRPACGSRCRASLRLAMILSDHAFGLNRVGVMSRRHLDFDREIVGDRVYRGPVTIAYRSPE
jgi:hypothetical protein